MGKLKDWWQKVKDDLADQKEQSKFILKSKWDQGAQQGKAMKEKQKNIIKGKKKEEKNES